MTELQTKIEQVKDLRNKHNKNLQDITNKLRSLPDPYTKTFETSMLNKEYSYNVASYNTCIEILRILENK